jgi:hypothetical protein
MATEKKPFIIRIEPETLAAVEKWAADEFRSTNGQIEWVLFEALKKSKRLPKKKHADTSTTLSTSDTDLID